MQNSVIFVKRHLEINIWKIKTGKVRDRCHYTGEYRGAVHRICNVKYSAPKEIPITLHNGSDYDYHFIIRELAEEFEKQITCLGENTEKYITFTVPIEKEASRIDKKIETKLQKINLTYYNL